MTVAYQVERFSTIVDEVQPLWKKHWLTSAVERDKVPLDPDIECYRKTDAAGLLHIVTVRKAGVLLGYFFNFVLMRSVHYGIAEAHSDIYFIDCDDAPMARLARYRGLLRFTTLELTRLGVRRALAPVKLHADLGAVFEREGWVPFERAYYKMLGG